MTTHILIPTRTRITQYWDPMLLCWFI